MSKIYDKNQNGIIDDHEIASMIQDYNAGKIPTDSRQYEILSKYDIDKNGKIDVEELERMRHAFSLNESQLRYTGYTLSLSRLFRYLAFTSDFGEALRPVIHKHLSLIHI